jgi:hypothetical protein
MVEDRYRAVRRTPVPEASVNEYREFESGKYEVRDTPNGVFGTSMSPIAIAVVVKASPQS